MTFDPSLCTALLARANVRSPLAVVTVNALAALSKLAILPVATIVVTFAACGAGGSAGLAVTLVDFGGFAVVCALARLPTARSATPSVRTLINRGIFHNLQN